MTTSAIGNRPRLLESARGCDAFSARTHCRLSLRERPFFRGAKDDARRAFTLLELLLVLALAGMMLAFAWPSLNRSLDTQRLNRGADLVRTHLLRARTKAITSGEIVSFRHQIDGGQFRVEQQSNNNAMLESGGMATGGPTGASGAPASAGTASSMNNSSGSASVEPLPPVEEQLPEGVKFLKGEVGTDSRMGYISINDRFTSVNDAAWSQPILFFPDGTATGAKIRVGGDRERSIEIELRSLTGGVLVGEVERSPEARR
jgi:type II secretion system protein H